MNNDNIWMAEVGVNGWTELCSSYYDAVNIIHKKLSLNDNETPWIICRNGNVVASWNWGKR